MSEIQTRRGFVHFAIPVSVEYASCFRWFPKHSSVIARRGRAKMLDIDTTIEFNSLEL